MRRIFEIDAARSDADLGIGAASHEMEVAAIDGTAIELFNDAELVEAFGVPTGGPSRNCASRRMCAPRRAAGSTPRSAVTCGRSVTLARQEARALLLIHNMTAAIAARAAGQAGIDPRLIPFTAMLALIRGHVTADTRCPHCDRRPASGNDPIALLVNQVLAQPAHRGRPTRTSGRTAFQRQHWHTEGITYSITIVAANLPKANIRPGS